MIIIAIDYYFPKTATVLFSNFRYAKKVKEV